MRAIRSTLARVTALTLSLGACDAAAPPDGPTNAGRLAIEVAPLSLSGVTDARYTLTVTNAADGAGETVWTGTYDSSAYGDGAGSLSYVGTCDADTGASSVTLVLEDLFQGVGVQVDPATYRNPTPITRNVPCVANADTPVVFDMTIARQANQGFFDIAVTFQDIFCSAKLDCVKDGTNDLELLFDAGGSRALTAVLGFACTGSPTGETYLYMDDPVISCTGLGADVTFDVAGQGNVDLGAAGNANPGGYLFGAAVYRGVEQLANKAYWNVAFGLKAAAFAAAGTCTLTARATASSTAFPQTPLGFPLPPNSVYPVVEWSVPLTNAAGRVCTAHALNDGDEVATDYLGYQTAGNTFTWGTEPITLRHRFERATGVVLTAAAPTCDDGLLNQDETDVDCGGDLCTSCVVGEACVDGDDCETGLCTTGVCDLAAETYYADATYAVPGGVTCLAVDLVGGGGGGGADDTMGSSGTGTGNGGVGGSSCVRRDTTVLAIALGGAGGSGRGDLCCTPDARTDGQSGAAATEIVGVVPGEDLVVYIGGGGGGGTGDYVHFSGPTGGKGDHHGASCEGTWTGGWYPNTPIADGGHGGQSTMAGGRGTDSGFDGNSPGGNGTANGASSGTGAGGTKGSGGGGAGGDGGRAVVRLPTAGEASLCP